MRRRLWAACAALVSAVLCASASVAQASVTQHGYLTAPDGSSLSYTVVLPSAQGRFPVAMDYDGYSAGYDPMTDNGDGPFISALSAKGFAVMGVNVPGTGCSSGSVYPRSARPGPRTVRRQSRGPPRSHGRPARWACWAPRFPGSWRCTSPQSDRAAWSRSHRAAGRATSTTRSTPVGSTTTSSRICLTRTSSRGASRTRRTPLETGTRSASGTSPRPGGPGPGRGRRAAPGLRCGAGAAAPLHDSEWTNLIWELKDAIPNIQVPVLTLNSYQDQIASGTGIDYYSLLDPRRSWFILTNGWHAIGDSSNTWVDETVAFLDHFVAGADNGWQNTPKVQIWHETGINSSGDVEPRWTTSESSWPLPTTTGCGSISAPATC